MVGLVRRGRVHGVDDQRARPHLAQAEQHVLVGGGLQVHVGQVELRERGQQRPVELGDLGLLRAPDARARREPDARAPRAHGLHGRLHRLHGEPDPVRDRPAVDVGAQVRAAGEELGDQVAVRPVQLDPVEARLDGPARGVAVGPGVLGDLGGRQRAGHRRGRETGRREHRPGRGDLRGPDRPEPGRVRVRHPAAVHDLGEQASAVDVHGVGDLPPRLGLLVGVQTGSTGVGLPDQAGLHPFRDDQPGGGALGVVGRHGRGGQTTRGRADPRHRGHHDPVGQHQVTEREAVEKAGHDCRP